MFEIPLSIRTSPTVTPVIHRHAGLTTSKRFHHGVQNVESGGAGIWKLRTSFMGPNGDHRCISSSFLQGGTN